MRTTRRRALVVLGAALAGGGGVAALGLTRDHWLELLDPEALNMAAGSTQAVSSTRFQLAPTPTPTPLQRYWVSLEPVLTQWWNALEARRGLHFLQTPASADFRNAGRLFTLLTQWWNALEAAQGLHFLVTPVEADIHDIGRLRMLLNQWWNALEGAAGTHFLLPLPA